MYRPLFRLVGVLFAAFLLVPEGPAMARELKLEHLLCAAGSDSAEEALALRPEQLDCSGDRFRKRDRFVRTRAEIPADYNTEGEPLLWQTDPSKYENMVLQFTFEDGEQRRVDVDTQTAARSWFVRTRFSVPVPDDAGRLVAVDTVVEKPRTFATLSVARLVPRSEAMQEHYLRSMLYALMCGLLIAPIVFDMLFFKTMRTRFMIWHALMTAGLLGYVVSNSGLIFHIWPDAPLGLRFQLNTSFLALATIASVLFILDLLEKDTVPRWLSRTTLVLAAIMFIAKTVMVVDVEGLRILSHSAFLVTMLPVTVAVLAIITIALFKGSRAAIYLLMAYSGVIIGGTILLVTALGLHQPRFHIDDFLFFAMVFLVLGTGAAVADRFMVLRVERDRARVNAIKMGRMAMSDPLTGLGNRRAFNSLRHIEEGQALLVADIDHFKMINDGNGHVMGDAVLCHMSSLMRDVFGDIPDSTIYRLGGEEFAVVFACNDEHALRRMGERLRDTIDKKMAGNSYGIPPATISVGGALGDGRIVTEVFDEADQALYRAKQGGRNRTAVKCNGSTPVLVEFEAAGSGI